MKKQKRPVNKPSEPEAIQALARDIINSCEPPAAPAEAAIPQMAGGIDFATAHGFRSILIGTPAGFFKTEPPAAPDERAISEARRKYALMCAMQLAMGNEPGPPYFTSSGGALEPERVVPIAREIDRFLAGD